MVKNVHAIKSLKRKGQYDKSVREQLIHNMSTYSKLPTKRQDKFRARRDVKKIEQRLGIVGG